MTDVFERIKIEIDDLPIEEVDKLIRELLRRQAFLGLDAEINDIPAILALIDFIKEKINLLGPGDKEWLIGHLRQAHAARQPRQTKRCAYCWSLLRG